MLWTMAIEIVGFSHENGDFSAAILNYQRVGEMEGNMGWMMDDTVMVCFPDDDYILLHMVCNVLHICIISQCDGWEWDDGR